MTVAALEVAALGRLLARRAQAAAAAGSSSGSWQDGLPREFQRAVLPVVQTAWALAAGNDVRWAGTESNEPTKALPARLLEAGAHGYLAAVFKLAATDAAVRCAHARVLGGGSCWGLTAGAPVRRVWLPAVCMSCWLRLAALMALACACCAACR